MVCLAIVYERITQISGSGCYHHIEKVNQKDRLVNELKNRIYVKIIIMYKRLVEDKTRTYYKRILYETITLTEQLFIKTHYPLYEDIKMQLCDIKLNVVNKQNITDSEEIFERYSIGAIAVKNLEDSDELQARLCDIFWGAVHYNKLSD